MRHKESIEKIINFLKSQDQQVVYEWSKLGSLKPYNENSNKSSLVAKEIGDALKNVDIFILVADEAGTDMFIELGIVIGRWLDNNKTKIYAVGKFNDRSLMHFHPAIKQVDKLSDVFSIECPELLTQEGAALLTSFDPM
ncbi:hypothetical protein CMI37_10540 [Candidatus Pacearchaeota archaeon]|nr:hypothetical protein [Candidatus Pacearchaeota archaeon]